MTRRTRFVGLLAGLVLWPVSAVAQSALTIASADGSNQMSVRGYAQIDYRAFLDDDHEDSANTFLIRRARIYIDGAAQTWFRFRITPDFAGGKLTLYDAYFEAVFSKAFVFKGGKFKVPIGLERLQVGSDLRFVERAFPTLVAPNRDIGIGVSGDVAGDRVSYATSLTNGVPDGLSADADTEHGKDLAGRIMVQAWSRESAVRRGTLTIGTAVSWGRAHGSAGLPGVPVVDQVGVDALLRFRSGVVADGNRIRVMPQATYYRGPLGVMAEYIRSFEDIERDDARARFRLAAWQVAGSWVVTGEKNSFQGVAPAKPLVPGSGNWGAIELAARYHALDVDPSLFPVFADPAAAVRSASAWDLAANWYWNRFVKFMFNYEHTTYAGFVPNGDRPPAHLFLARMQFSL